MIVRATATYSEVLMALGLKEIPGCEWELGDDIQLNEVEIDETSLDLECDLCGGEGIPEAEPEVDPNLIRDFVRAIKDGNLKLAQCLVGRVFDVPEDAATVDQALRLVA